MLITEQVNSSAIDKIEYNTVTSDLKVFFNSDVSKGYDFPGVPKEEVEGFIKAESKGKYYHKRIKRYAR